MTTTKSIAQIISFVLILVGLVAYNFLGAQTWTAPGNTPPNGNVWAPVNVSASTQSKDGNFNAYIVSADTAMWSPLYCDEMGANCFDIATIDQFIQSRTCPAGEFMRGVNADGTLVCTAVTTTTGPTCRVEYKTVGGCYTSAPYLSCGTGWTRIGVMITGVSCSTNGQRYSQQCSRNVCI